MSRTRNERKRDSTYILALTVIVAAMVTILLSVAYLMGQHDAVVEPAQQSEVVAKVIPTEIIVLNDSEPEEEQEIELDESLVQQEARMPEFGYDYEYVMRVVAAESRGEPYEGQVAVGAVILNRVKSSEFPNSIAGVIYQPGAFTAVSDGQINEPIDKNSTVYKAARDAMNGWDPTNGCIYYYNPDTATNKWIWSRPLVKKIGKHKFCK